jgi:hypothetical protein
MRVPAFLLCFFLSASLLLAREAATVSSDATGITVVFDGLSARVENSEKGVSAHIDNSSYRVPRTSRDVELDMIQMLVALPEGDVPQPVLTIGKETYLATGKLVRDEHGPTTFVPVSLEPSVEIKVLGRQRGITIAALYFYPYRYDVQTRRLSWVSGAMVSLRYTKPVTAQTGKTSQNAMPMSADLINRNILPALLEQSRAHTPHAITSIDETNEWYSPSGIYVKLTTTRDGIAKITASDITAAEPGFAGQDISHIRLLLEGREYPLAVQNDNDGILNAGDELYFMGRRAYGDTTWFDTYTDQCAFFLTVSDVDLPARRFSDFQTVNETFGTVETVRIDRHEEKDRVYYLGDDTDYDHTTTLHRSQTVRGEGWYWGMFNYDPSNKSNFEYVQVLTPSENPADVLSIGYHTYSVSDNRAFELDHQSAYELNELKLGEDIPYNGFRKSDFRKDIPSSEMLAGANMLRLRAVGVEENRRQPNYTEITAVDYFTFRGTVRPFAWKGILDCSILDIPDNRQLSMPGFSSPVVYTLDTVQQRFMRVQGRAGTTIRTGARSGATPAATIVVNDSIAVYSATAGINIVIVPASNPAAMTVRQYTNPAADAQQIKDFVQSAADGSVIVVALAGVELPQEVKTLFQSLGSTRVQQIGGEAAWVFAARKAGTVVCDKVASGTVAGSAFLAHTGGNSYEATLALAGLANGDSYRLISCDEAHVEQAGVVAIQPVNLKDNSSQADVLIVTHRDFREQADSLARYRRAKNNMNVQVVDAEDIYKQFSYGRKSPHGIKAFLSYAYHNWQQPKPLYLVLFGDASWDARNVSDGAITHDFIPTYGRPVSDFWYTLLDGDDLLPDLIAGRISVETPAQAQSVVRKIVEYESLPKQPWMKRFLMMSGGKDSPSRPERTILREHTIRDYIEHLLPTPLCVEIDTVFKQDDNEASVSQATTIRSKINSGAVWVSYVGHASPVTFDMDFGKASDLNNGNQYPVLATYSCQTAAFAEPYITGKNEDFVREAGKGFIGAFGTTGFGEVSVDRETAWNMYKAMRFDSLRALGDILFSAKTAMAGFADQSYYENTLYQHSLLGDPLLTLALEREPDLYLLRQDIQVVGKSGSSVIAENDSTVTLRSLLRNAGVHAKFFEYDVDSIPSLVPIHILIVREYEGHKDSVQLLLDEICADVPFSAAFNVMGMPGQHFITIHVNSDSTEPEATFSNNILYDTLTVYPSRAFALDPLPYWNVEAREPVFRVVNPVNIGELNMEFALSQSGDPNSAPLVSKPDDVRYEEAFTQWQPSSLMLSAGSSYWLHIRTRDKLGEYGEWINIPFTASEGFPREQALWTLRRAEHFNAGVMEHLAVEAFSDSTKLTLDDYDIPVHVISNGNKETRNLLIEINGSQIIDWTTFHGGFNISILSPGSARPRAYRWYDTFSVPNPKSMGNSSDMIRFLRDSVAVGETAVIAVYDEAFAGPIEVQKNLDTLVETLKLFGSVLADSLLAHGDGSVRNSSFILIGRKGGPLVTEAWKLADGSQEGVEIDTSLVVHDLVGQLVTPVVGPATQWQSVSLDTRNTTDDAFTITVIGRKSNGQEDPLLRTTASILDLSSISAAEYPYLKFSVEFSRENEEQHPVLTGLRCSFVPTAELAVREAETGPAADSVLRGDFVHFRATVQNISRRVAAQPFTLETDIRAAGSATAPPLLFSVPINTLAPDALYNFENPVPTTELAAVSDIIVTAYPGEEELYSFNNKRAYSLHVQEDNQKPSIVVEMDGKVVRDGDYVSEQPATVIRLMDNSSLTINSPEKLLVSLNGRYRNDSQPNMENYQFFSEQVGNERARAEFTALLESGVNSLRVVAEDATGNRDTTYITVSVATSPVIKKFLSSPNPFSEQTTITFLLGDKQQPTGGEAVVYNTTGRLVRKVELKPHIGPNSFTWDALDDEGRSVAEGVYLIRIFIRGVDGMFESPTQKAVLIR